MTGQSARPDRRGPRARTTAAAAVVLALALGACAGPAAPAAGAGGAAGPAADTAAAPVAGPRMSGPDYWSWVGETLEAVIAAPGTSGPAGPGSAPQLPATANEQLRTAIGFVTAQREEFASTSPPEKFEPAHRDYVRALDLQIESFGAALAALPAEAPVEQYYDVLYGDADSADAFVAETNAKCALNRAADSWGYPTYDFQRFCAPEPRPGATVGAPDSPVTSVTLVNEVYGDGTLPNLWYDVTEVHAVAGEPFRFTFDNRNTAPFLFNIAVYEGVPDSLTGLTPVAVTRAGPGPEVQELEVELPPGDYTYTDNVHAYSMRGVLHVVG